MERGPEIELLLHQHFDVEKWEVYERNPLEFDVNMSVRQKNNHARKIARDRINDFKKNFRPVRAIRKSNVTKGVFFAVILTALGAFFALALSRLMSPDNGNADYSIYLLLIAASVFVLSYPFSSGLLYLKKDRFSLRKLVKEDIRQTMNDV